MVNITAMPNGTSYSYDAENHLLSTAGVSYTYDGDGNRVEKSSGTIYWHGGLDESNLSGSLTNEYIFFGGQRIARRDPSSNVFYYFSDHLGTARSIAEVPSGQTTATKCYDADLYPFGGERWYTDTCDSHFKFTGKERDPESGLDYFKARHFGSSMGRFMSSDPFTPLALKRDKFNAWINNPQRWNKYTYALNNPLSYVDPDGMNACGTNDDSTCIVTVTITARSTDKNGKYNDQYTAVTNQQNYNATATVSVNGQVVGTYLARTTPSDPSSSATIASGTYSATLVQHDGAPALLLHPSKNIPTVGPNPHQGGAWFATSILVHQSGLNNFTGVGHDGRAVSEGCQVIARSQYSDFETASGMTPGDGSVPQQNFTVTMDTPDNRLYEDPVIGTPIY